MTVPVDLARPLADRFGRVHRDLRISVTDRCNFRCTYCMPAEGMDWHPRSDLLTFEELTRVATVCVERFGFDSIRLTGGEPTVRARLPHLVEMLSPLGVDLALTTNGSTLTTMAHDLHAAGLDRINISLDSLQPERFAALTRRDELPRVLDGIRAAVAAGFDPVKVNVVVVRGVNDDEIVDFARFGRDEGVVVRFIEFMPLDAEQKWTSGSVLPSAEIVAAIDAVFPLEAIERGSDPAQTHRYLDGTGAVGVIGTVTEPFCSSCDRVRLTADGQLRACLFATDETDLRTLLRSGGTDDDLEAALVATVAGKWAGHGISEVSFTRPTRSMSEIGG
ncbi:GTP 3',8-cyclase MoaA [Aquihabitans sp. McL0605]|uniref:GTP 3',8-cyclase MoaA n=1 Tax=Aquihabitans sp. McL0605 TaxID=3415671 RepID=UPI003CE8036A